MAGASYVVNIRGFDVAEYYCDHASDDQIPLTTHDMRDLVLWGLFEFWDNGQKIRLKQGAK